MNWDAFVAGLFFGTLLCVGVVAVSRDLGRSDCEKDLPRTQQCAQVWVPQESSK